MLKLMAGDQDLLRPTAKIAAAYLASQKLEADEVASLISSVAASLGGASTAPVQNGDSPPAAEPVRRTPAQVRKSIRADGLISFEDNRSYRTLKRHLASRGLTPEAYRVKWGLPSSYPMVCPDYSAVRADLARQIGLGRGGRQLGAAAAASNGSAKTEIKRSRAGGVKGKPNPAPSAAGRGKAAKAAEAKAAPASARRGEGPKAGGRPSARLPSKGR